MNAALLALATALSQEAGLSEQTRSAALQVLSAAQDEAELMDGYAKLMGA